MSVRMKNDEINEKGQAARPAKKPTHINPFIGDDELTADPEYMQLLVEYQNARWDECNVLLNNLLKKYPGNRRLAEFQQDFEFQYLFHKSTQENVKEKHKRDASIVVRRFSISFGLIVLAVAVAVGIFVLVYSLTISRQQNYNKGQIDLLGLQVQSLLASGQPEKASEILQQMKLIDPQNPEVVALGIKTNELLAVNQLYNDAIAKINAGMDSDALALLLQIQSTNPSFRDTALLVEQTNNRIQVKQLSDAAATAYTEGRWQDAIDNYEQVLTLNPDSENPNLKEQLLNSYLRRIIEMMNSDQTTVDDINKAEIYYRRAVAMIPQSRTFSTERDNLQKISSSLLEVKYSQTALALVSDPNQTEYAITQAVNFMKKAANLNPNSNLLQSEVDKIQLYQVAFSDYVQMDWRSAIDSLNTLYAMDKGYANGNVNQLLYEAYMGRGNQYYSVGLYNDARKDYEAAENLAWESGDNNLTQIFMVEVDLGYAFGQLRDYQNAASYFKSAVEAVDYANRAAAYPTFVNDIANAGAMYETGSYRNSYNLYEQALQDKYYLFDETEINALESTCFAYIARQNRSSVQAILEYNQLSKATLISYAQTLKIPYLP